MTEDAEPANRRTVLQAIGVAGAFGLAGCVGGGRGSEDPGVETDDPTATGTPAEETTATGSRTPTTTQTRTRTTASGPKPTAGVSVETDEDDYTVTLVSLGATTDHVELAGCGGGQTLPEVGEEATATGCGPEDPLKIFAVAEDGRRALVQRYPIASESDEPGGKCESERSGAPTAGVNVEQGLEGERDPAVTLVSLGEGTRGVELRGCGTVRSVTRVGETASVTGCNEGDVLEVVAVGCDGETALIHETNIRDTDTDTATATPTPELSASVDVRYDESDPVATLTDRSESTAAAVLEGCADGQTLREVGASATLSGCRPGDTVVVVPIGDDGTLGVRRAVTVEGRVVPDDVGLEIDQGDSGVTVRVDDLGSTITEVAVGGCGDGTIGEGESTTIEDCTGQSLPLTANHVGGESVVIATYEYEAAADGGHPNVNLFLARSGPKALVLVNEMGGSVESVDIEGCGGDLDRNSTVAKTDSCAGDERVTISVRTRT